MSKQDYWAEYKQLSANIIGMRFELAKARAKQQWGEAATLGRLIAMDLKDRRKALDNAMSLELSA